MTENLADCATCPVRQIAIYAPLGCDDEPVFQATRRGTLTYDARELLTQSGDHATEIYTLQEGWAFRFILLPGGRRQILTFLLPGNFIGKAALLGRRVHVSVQALTKVRICAFDPGALTKLFDNRPELMKSLASNYAMTMAAYVDMTTDLGRRNARERIARFILHMERRLKRRGMAYGDSWNFPLHRQHLADALGMTPVHVSRSLSAIRRDGILAIERQSVSILDRARLIEAASE